MSRAIIVAALAFVAMMPGVFTEGAAKAGPWCQTDEEWTLINCSFVSLEQCRATISGVGGNCLRNPMSEPAPAPRPTTKKR